MSIINQHHQKMVSTKRKVMTYSDLRMQKRNAKRAADELYYAYLMPDVMERIDNAKNTAEVNLIMKTCRNMM